MESFDISGLLGKRVNFSLHGSTVWGKVVGGYVDVNPNGKRNVVLLIDTASQGIEEIYATACRCE